MERSSKQILSKSTAVPRPDQTGHGYPDGQGDSNTDDDGDDSDDAVDNNSNHRCPMCFMEPCVTESQRHLGGSGQEPSDYNPSIRKGIYRRFWSVIDNLGGWQIDLYTTKKREEAHRHNIVYMKREIMPECILTFVRGLYPNPAGQPYMGHKWE